MSNVTMSVFGFTTDELSSLIQEHGQEVLDLVVQAVKNGMSKDFVVSVLQLGGKVLLELLTTFSTVKTSVMAKKMSVSADAVVEGDLVNVLPVLDNASVLVDVLKQLLPTILEKVGPTLVQELSPKIVAWIISLLK